MKHLLVALGLLLVPIVCASCQGEPFGDVRARRRLAVELVPPSTPGTRTAPLPLTVNTANLFHVRITALAPDGSVDRSFHNYVRISAKPGAVERVDAPGAVGRNVLLDQGVSPDVAVSLANAFGTTYILADDLGYVPADPVAKPPPQCANGLDDDGDGTIDFPADEGCAFPNDNAEEGGGYAQGTSAPIFIQLPRVADVRGLVCDAAGACDGSGVTPYQKEQIIIDSGFHERPDGTEAFDFDLVVTRIAQNGFYVTDTKDTRGGELPAFSSIFAFNFNAPPRMRVCDRLKSFTGTANEFFGFTQLSYPTWTLEEWDPQRRPCLVPEPLILTPTLVKDATVMRRISGALVRAETFTTPEGTRERTALVTPKFGPADMARGQTGVFIPSADATNCDFNNDGRISFNLGPRGCTATPCPTGFTCVSDACQTDENVCQQTCADDPECTEYSNFITRGSFRITVRDAGGAAAAVQADASALSSFDPVAFKGREVRSFSGTLHFFSGGSQFTIEARCPDDIILDLAKSPIPSDKACVFPRTEREINPQ